MRWGQKRINDSQRAHQARRKKSGEHSLDTNALPHMWCSPLPNMNCSWFPPLPDWPMFFFENDRVCCPLLPLSGDLRLWVLLWSSVLSSKNLLWQLRVSFSNKCLTHALRCFIHHNPFICLVLCCSLVFQKFTFDDLWFQGLLFQLCESAGLLEAALPLSRLLLLRRNRQRHTGRETK